MKKTILADRHTYHEVIEEEKYNFLRSILFAMDLPCIEECMPENYTDQTIQQKIELRAIIKKFDLFIREMSKDTMEILLDGKPIAEFKKPFSKLMEDPGEPDPIRKKYLNIELNFSHPFQE